MKPPSANSVERYTASFFKNPKDWMFEHYGENPGKMLVHTGTVGWILSSLAQISAIVTNDKYTKEQKMFLLPQEMADAAINILSFYAFTNGIKKLTTKFLKTAKLRNKATEDILRRDGFILEKGATREPEKVYAGDFDFDITKLDNYQSEIKSVYKDFKNGAEVSTGLIGSIISCNIFTPIVRNMLASKTQKSLVEKHQAATEKKDLSAKQPLSSIEKTYTETIPRPSMKSFAASTARPTYTSGGLRI